MTRKGGTVTCKNCGLKGHNKRSCKKRQRTDGDEGPSADGNGDGQEDNPV